MVVLRFLGTSCASLFKPYEHLTFASTAGRWVHDGTDGHQTVMTLKEDGTLTATGIPIGVIRDRGSILSIAQVDWIQTQDLAGTWAPEWNSGINEPYVSIEATGLGLGHRLYADDETDAIALYFPLGDPDGGQGFFFTKS